MKIVRCKKCRLFIHWYSYQLFFFGYCPRCMYLGSGEIVKHGEGIHG